MDDFHKDEKTCLANVNLVKRRMQDFEKALKRYMCNAVYDILVMLWGLTRRKMVVISVIRARSRILKKTCTRQTVTMYSKR